MLSLRTWALCALTLGLAPAVSASASVIPPMSMNELVGNSDVLVHGVVVDQSSQWEETDGNRIIFTYSTVRILNADRPHFVPGTEVVVRSVGGRVDDYQQVLVGEASLRLHEEVIAFLGIEEDWAHPSVVGFHQGKFRVVRSPRGSIVGVVPDAGQQVDPAVAERSMVPISSFVVSLRRAMAGKSTDQDPVITHPLVRAR